jgi:LysM repeat protein
MSACLVLVWCLLAITVVAGTRGPGGPAQPSPGSAATSSTAAATAETTPAAPASRPTAAGSTVTTVTGEATAPAAAVAATTEVTEVTVTAEVTAARLAAGPAARWTVRPGDTLSAIAGALGVPGGWPALYAANRAVVGPDPGLIRPGTVLAIPARQVPARYTVAPGDTLSGVAAALGVPGGWPALYAANRATVGPDPDLISAGTILTVPRPAAPATGHAGPQGQPPQAPGSAPAPAGSHPAGRPAAPGQATVNGHRTAPGHRTVPAGGMPRWLQDVLLAAGVLAATAFAAEPAAAFARRRRDPARPGRTRPARPRAPGTADAGGVLETGGRGAARGARRAARKARIIFADHERLIVTYSARDRTVYVLTPPGEDPRAVLRAARLVLPEDTYEDLAGRLGVPSAWPLE